MRKRENQMGNNKAATPQEIFCEAFNQGVKTGRKAKLAEVKETLASMVINEMISSYAYDHIMILIGESDGD